MMSHTWPAPKEGQRLSGRLPIVLSTAALFTSMFALWSVLTPADPTQRLVTMSTQANLLNAATNTAGSSMAAGLHPTQQQLDELAEQTLSIIHAPKARVPQPAAAAAAAVTKPAPPCNTTAPATAPGQQDPLSGLKAQFLQQVLSLTNYSQLGSAPLLDPLIPSKNYQLMQEVVQQQQTLFCRANLHDQDIPGAHQVNAQGMQLNVYSSGDIVSTSISRSQSWEPAIIHQLQWAISQYKPNTGSGSGTVPLVLDIGSNVGWLTFSAAKAGARVVAFEGMPMNQVLLRKSLCNNPDLMQRITLFATGLGDTNKDCTVVSSHLNAGNGNVICSADVAAGMAELSKKEPGNQYSVKGTMSLRPLDDLFSDDVHLMKIDVEGFEESVLKGAQRLMSSKRVKYLITEANSALRGREGSLAYVKMMYELGFNISYNGFSGPFLPKEQIYDANAPTPPMDYFGVRRD